MNFNNKLKYEFYFIVEYSYFNKYEKRKKWPRRKSI